MLCQLPPSNDPNLLSSAIPFADAGVYRIAENQALVQSVDFFTPVVDDPYRYGQIAAANALSDIFAMGGRPLTVLNLVGFPSCTLGTEVLTEILKGSAQKVAEAGAVVVGGHTVEDEEPKFGLAVTGLVDPQAMVTTVGARPGDRLILTKPLGTGILTTALKGEVIDEAQMSEAIEGMATLNQAAARVMLEVGVSACTDITGFGLLGHGLEMAEASGVCVVLEGKSLPVYPQVREMAAMGLVPEGSYKNRDYYLPRVEQAESVPAEIIDLIADPQTSGGLLIAVSAEKSKELLEKLKAAGCGAYAVGRVEESPRWGMRVE